MRRFVFIITHEFQYPAAGLAFISAPFPSIFTQPGCLMTFSIFGFKMLPNGFNKAQQKGFPIWLPQFSESPPSSTAPHPSAKNFPFPISICQELFPPENLWQFSWKSF